MFFLSPRDPRGRVKTLYSEWLFDLHPDPAKCHEIYREFVLVKLASTESIWEKLVGQIYLGSAEWVERMRKVVAEKPRSDEHARAQRLIPRLKMATVVKAVAKICGIEEKDLRHRHGGAPRMLATWIGWNEGLLRLREIAAALRLRSFRSVSTPHGTARAVLRRLRHALPPVDILPRRK